MHHGREHKLELTRAECEPVAVLHLQEIGADAIEALHHAEGLLVAHKRDVGVILADEFDGTAVVGLHVIDDEIVDGAVANDLLDIPDIRDEEIHLNGIHETHLLIDDEIGVVGHAVGQGPEPLEKILVAVVDTHVIGAFGNLLHIRHD